MPEHKPNLKNTGIPKTLSESIYLHLKSAIISNQITADQRLIEKDIAADFGVSTTPVREAILKLGAEGYIAIDSHRKAVVRKISVQEVKDIYEVLASLDEYASGTVIGKIDESGLRELEKILDIMELDSRNNRIEEHLNANGDFHRCIWKYLPNHFLEKTLCFVQDQLLRYTYARVTAFQEKDLLLRSFNDHKMILAAIRAENRKELKKLIKKNWGFLLDYMPLVSTKNKISKKMGGGKRSNRTKLSKP